VIQVGRSEKNTTLNANTEQFITAILLGNALKQGSRTAVHNCNITRQRVETGEQNILSATSGQFANGKI